MSRRLRHRSDAESTFSCTRCPPVLTRVIIFVLAFAIGHWNVPTASNLDLSFQPSEATGWQTIHVFYGNATHEEEQAKWHSQVGQDELVASLLGNMRNGFFVDLAANDAVHWSNTFALERHLGWKGLCIEPTPRYWNDLVVMRDCHVVGAVVGNATSSLVPWRRRKEYSGIVGQEFDNVGAEGRVFPIKYTISLESIFHKMQVPYKVEYLSLDVEGAEEYIMKDFLSREYSFSFMTIERPSQTLMTLLKSHDYVFLATLSDWGETIWAHRSVSIHNKTLLENYQEKYRPWKPDTKKPKQ